MSMITKYGAGPDQIDGMNTDQLRDTFMVEGLFRQGEIKFAYTHVDRMIVGGAMPGTEAVSFGDGADVGTEYFFDAREMGIANLGGRGWIEVDGERFELANRDVLYVGRGAKEVRLASDDAGTPARFYMNSVPAQVDIPHRLVRRDEAEFVTMGDEEKSNKRTLGMYIHPKVAPSCLLLMGITDPAPNSIWNTMPPHTHERRMEAYCYFEVGDEDRVMHFMGQPQNTRHLVVADMDVILSPAWSIHMGAGTGPYAFVWGMTGENQAYTDMQPVAVKDLR